MAHLMSCGSAYGVPSAHQSFNSNNCVNLAFSYLRPCMRRGANLAPHPDSLTKPRTTVHKFSRTTRSARPVLTTATSVSIGIGSSSTTAQATPSAEEQAEAESLQILEWPAICKQVACFCGTSVAAELIARGQHPRGRDREESQLLLQQTAEALECGLEVQGCFDIRPAVEAAAAGLCLNGKQLEGVASTLEAAFALKLTVTAAAQPEGDSGGAAGPAGAGKARLRYPTLAALAEGISEEERTLLRAIRECIQFGGVSDSASEALAAVRRERQANKERLRVEVESWARLLRTKGAADSSNVTLVRGRFCVGVRAGRQGELPKGSVRLGASSTGATLYVEPKPCVELNNAEALLADREEQEVARVLGLLSRMLGSRGPQLQALVKSFTALDVVAARAKHARWLSGVRPSFVDEPGRSPFHVPGALHPVLMQRGLPPLPQPPSVDDNRFDRDFQAAPAWEPRRVLVPDGPRSGEEVEGGEGPGSLMPRPLDLRVPEGRTVVAITGPNTGGKTVTLKAAGLAVLMAQAGLFLPCHPDQLAAHGPPRLAWFDRVLADIGDAQSLQQNLSTFSGHIRRIRQILSVAGMRSLVLLDEVGSGTDPLEGAALARAVLDRLASQAHLTLATTHHAELKRAADDDPRYINVSMAFDTATLRPAYRLVWGSAGASNALDIAETLGFDRSIVLEARAVAQAMAESSASAAFTGRDARVAGVARSLAVQLEETRAEVEAQRALRERRRQAQAQVQETITQVREMEYQLKQSPKEIVLERDTLASEVQTALDAFAAGLRPQASVETALSRIEALIPEEVAAYRGQHYSGADDEDDGVSLRPGDAVFVKSYGDMGYGSVVSVKGDHVTVKFDAMPVFAGGRVAGRGVKLHKREVQRTREGSAVPFASDTRWMSRYADVAADIRKVLGEVSEQERAEAAEAAARRKAQQARQEMEAAYGEAAYEDLYGFLQDGDETSLGLGPRDYGSPDQNFLVEGLDEPEILGNGGGSGSGDGQHGASGRGGKAGASSGSQPTKSRAATRAEAAAAAAMAGSVVFAMPEQSADNTLDVAGEVPELAAADLDDYIRDAPPGAAFYVRHGMGTGAVRDAVHAVLVKRRAPKGRVREWREAPGSRGEATVVWL